MFYKTKRDQTKIELLNKLEGATIENINVDTYYNIKDHRYYLTHLILVKDGKTFTISAGWNEEEDDIELKIEE